MTTPTQPDEATPQALKPPYFPAQTVLNPLASGETYEGGIPIRALEGGLQVIIPAWLEMKLGDTVKLFWIDPVVPVWTHELKSESELNQDVTFILDKELFFDGDAFPVFYRIATKNQPEEEFRPHWNLLVKLTRPGGYDDIAGDDGHSGLNFTLDYQEVDEHLPAKGVTMRIVPYSNCTRFDRILARWGHKQIVHTVTPAQAENPVANPIEIVFSRADIEAAGDGSRVAVAFHVSDRCGNHQDERAPWSATTHILVDLGGNRLAEPLVRVKDKTVENVNLEELGDDDVVVRVYVAKEDFAVGDDIELTWFGTPAQGPQIIVGPLTETVTELPFHFDFKIPNASVAAIAKGSATCGYVRIRENEEDRPSKNVSVNVLGEISQLRAPTVNEAPGGTLPPDTEWANVLIPWYPGRNSSDLVNMAWTAQAPDGTTVYYEDPRTAGDVPEHQPIVRSVSNAQIQRFNGLSVQVYYVVTNSETGLMSVRKSLPFIMQVGVALPTFERPEVEEAVDDVLIPDNVPPTGATLVLTHLGTRDKDRLNYQWRGSATGGSISGHVDLIPETAGNLVRITIAKHYVTANDKGSVQVDYDIQRGGVTLGRSHTLPLRIGAAHVKPEISSLKDGEGFEIPQSPQGMTAHPDIVLRGKATPGFKVEILDGSILCGTPTADSDGNWTQAISGLTLGNHSYIAKALYGEGQTSNALGVTKASGTETLFLRMAWDVETTVHPSFERDSQLLVFAFLPQPDGSTGIRARYNPEYALHMNSTRVWCERYNGHSTASFFLMEHADGSLVIKAYYHNSVLAMGYSGGVRSETYDPNDVNFRQRFWCDLNTQNPRIQLFCSKT